MEFFTESCLVLDVNALFPPLASFFVGRSCTLIFGFRAVFCFFIYLPFADLSNPGNKNHVSLRGKSASSLASSSCTVCAARKLKRANSRPYSSWPRFMNNRRKTSARTSGNKAWSKLRVCTSSMLMLTA